MSRPMRFGVKHRDRLDDGNEATSIYYGSQRVFACRQVSLAYNICKLLNLALRMGRMSHTQSITPYELDSSLRVQASRLRSQKGTGKGNDSRASIR